MTRLRAALQFRTGDRTSRRHVAPDGVASADAPLEPFLFHTSLFRTDEIQKRIAGNVDEVMRREQPFDLLARPAAGKREPVSDRGVFRTFAGMVERSSGSGKALTSAWLLLVPELIRFGRC